jgi:hypothetical protein
MIVKSDPISRRPCATHDREIAKFCPHTYRHEELRNSTSACDRADAVVEKRARGLLDLVDLSYTLLDPRTRY